MRKIGVLRLVGVKLDVFGSAKAELERQTPNKPIVMRLITAPPPCESGPSRARQHFRRAPDSTWSRHSDSLRRSRFPRRRCFLRRSEENLRRSDRPCCWDQHSSARNTPPTSEQL